MVERQSRCAQSASLPSFTTIGEKRRDPRGPLGDRRVELLMRDDAVDDPHPPRLVRVDALAKQQQLGRCLAADVAATAPTP